MEQWISKDAPPPEPGLEGAFTPQAMKEIFVLNLGGYTAVIEGKDGFYLFYVDEKTPQKTRPYNEVARQVGFDFNRQTQNETIGAFVKETFERQKVKIYQDAIIKGMEAKEAK